MAWFAPVYLNHHYVIDLVLGSLYAAVAWGVSRFVLVPFFFDRFVDYGLTSRRLLESSFALKAEGGGEVI